MFPAKRKDDVVSQKRKEESHYISMVKNIFNVCRRQCVTLFLSRFSRKDFTLWQHIALIALMQRVRKSYRKYVNDYLTTTERLLDVLGLSKIPHFTTIEKFLLRVPGILLERVLGGFIGLTRVRWQVFSPRCIGLLPSTRIPLLLRPPHQEGDILSSMRKQVRLKERSERR